MATKLVSFKGRRVTIYTYPSVPDSDHQWCLRCKRAMLSMENSPVRICPLCGEKVKAKGGKDGLHSRNRRA